jgi:hypothetical protein
MNMQQQPINTPENGAVVRGFAEAADATSNPIPTTNTISTMASDHKFTYASNVDGLPKTDFDAMRTMAHSIVDERLTEGITLFFKGDGEKVGAYVLAACTALEEMMAKRDFNAFIYPEPKSETTRWLQDMVVVLSIVNLFRSRVREFEIPMYNVEISYTKLEQARSELKDMLNGLVALAKQKDGEYGASWCKRGGIGAWFTTVRKFDRLVTQVTQKGKNIWDVSDDINSTEALEETIKDGINYLLLILEKRQAIHKSRG